MIAFDTNVWVRLFTRDEPAQFAQAYKLFKAISPEAPAWISLANLMEIDWVLRRRYGLERAAVVKVFDDLLASSAVVVEQMKTVADALSLYRTSRAHFGECLVVASARAAGCAKVYTFDKIAARDLGMEQIKA